jgi:hypothetical protein
LVSVSEDGVPRLGVVNVGLVAKTNAPDPVSSVTAAARFAEDGVTNHAATFVPRPEMPVDTGSPVALVSVNEVGVPRLGVVNVGEVASTLLPVPVLVTLTMFLLTSKASAVLAVKPESVVVDEADNVVNAPVFGVVAPTVPLILIDAVPVRFVTVPLEGVPSAPPLTTKAPEEPVLIPRAVRTPVPVVVVDGARPAPPPITSAFAVSAPEEAQVDALEK